MPHERFVYLGDTARVPYGNRSTETVQRYAQECTRFLLSHDVKLIVVACNTVSALALEQVRAMSAVPVVDMIEPASTVAASATRGITGVIGTRATVNSGAYANAIRSKNAKAAVHVKACPLFVPLVEEGWLDTAATRAIAEEYLRPLISQNIDTLVLGCTHYPLLKTVIADLLPGVTLVDCGESASEVANAIVRDRPGSGPDIAVIDLYVTDHTPAFTNLAQQFLGKPVDDPTVVSLLSSFDSTEQS